MRVTQLNTYPIKSTAPLPLTESEVGARGLPFDRHWSLVGEDGVVITAREYPELLAIRSELSAEGLVVLHESEPLFTLPYQRGEGRQKSSLTIFEAPATGWQANDQVNAWFSGYLGTRCRLVFMDDGDHRRLLDADGRATEHPMSYADECPLLLISEASLEHLNGRLEEPVSMRNFRPNIVVSGCEPHAEDEWGEVAIGTAGFDKLWQCQRCVFTTIDPESRRKHPRQEPLRTLSSYRRHADGGVAFGVYLIARKTGRIAVGDTVEPR